MKLLSFYDPVTGAIQHQRLTGPDTMDVALHTPPGMAAIEGHFDWRTQRVNVETLEVEECEAPPPSLRDAAVIARFERTVRLVATDLLVILAHERGEEVPPELVAHRQALRDVPQQPGFPLSIDWPMPPAP